MRSIYDWDRWFSRKRFTLRRGVHYAISTAMMCQTVRTNASKRGLSVSVMDGDGTITVVVHNPVAAAVGA